jgi:hypothetical protein
VPQLLQVREPPAQQQDSCQLSVQSRDIPMTLFPLVLRKEYFDCPQRDSHAVHYI